MINAYRNSISVGGPANRQDALDHLLNIYHNDPRKLTTEQKQMLAEAAYMAGKSFDVKSKPIRKALFDFVDTAALGLIPNEWRPSSVGQEYFGESGIDKFAGGLGTAAGIVPGLVTGGAALKTGVALAGSGTRAAGKAKGAYDAYRAGETVSGGGKLANAVAKAKEAAARARAEVNAQFYRGYNSVRPFPSYGSGSAPLQIGTSPIRGEGFILV